MRAALNNPESTRTRERLDNAVRTGTENEVREVDGLGPAATTGAARFERELRRGVLDQPQYQPVVSDGFDG
jgi:hypothetical protein